MDPRPSPPLAADSPAFAYGEAVQRVIKVRRDYNSWVASETMEDYALRFTPRSFRKWSELRVANTAFGASSFLVLEAVGATLLVQYGFLNAFWAIVVTGLVIFLAGLPISIYAARHGLDMDLLSRGAGFGYIGSTITSLIYASFTFIFFALEAAIMAYALELAFDIPPAWGYLVCAVVVVPMVTHGVTAISAFQVITQPLWIALLVLPFFYVMSENPGVLQGLVQYPGADGRGAGFNLNLFGAGMTLGIALITQMGEQADYLRFMPEKTKANARRWWAGVLIGGPGWVVIGVVKMLGGALLAYLAISHAVPVERAVDPNQMYLAAYEYVFPGHYGWAVAATALLVIVSQLKINVTNAYAGSLAWSNFFARLTHSHPGRVVWVVFNTLIALMLMELDVFQALGSVLGLYSNIAIAWMMAVVADLVINKPLGLSPRGIEFKRAHLYDINPVGVGAMGLASVLSIVAHVGVLGETAQAFSALIALVTAFVASPLIAWMTQGRYYIARLPAPAPAAVPLRFVPGAARSAQAQVQAQASAPADESRRDLEPGSPSGEHTRAGASRSADFATTRGRIDAGTDAQGAFRSQGNAEPGGTYLGAALATRRCTICEREYEPDDMAHCPAYEAPICSLCCSLDARCHDLCKPESARAAHQMGQAARWLLPRPVWPYLDTGLGHYVLLMSVVVPALALLFVALYRHDIALLPAPSPEIAEALRLSFVKAFFALVLGAGIVAWWLVLTHKSRQVAQEESNRQTQAVHEQTIALRREIESHHRTDAALQEAKRAADLASQAKTRYISTISHELRTPLNSILGYAQLLDEDADLPPHRRQAVNVILRGGDHLLSLIEGTLDIARIEGGKLKLDPRPMRFREGVRQIARMFELQAAAKGIAFRTEIADGIPEVVRADERRLRQILINVLGNAVKFTSVGSVDFRVSYAREMAVFEIEDTGPGIAPEEIEHVFEPFARGSGAAQGPGGGTGLGLTISKMLTDLMGGEMSVHSTPAAEGLGGQPGFGTRFRIRLFLPEVRAALAERALPRTPPSGYAGARRRVLVVDNEEVDRTLLASRLGQLGFEVAQAASGDACLALLPDCRPDAILMDLAMPGIDGWETIRRIRANRLSDAPVAIVSANAFDKGMENDVGIGVGDFITKPLRVAELLDWLERRLQLQWIDAPRGAALAATPQAPLKAEPALLTTPSRAAAGAPRARDAAHESLAATVASEVRPTGISTDEASDAPAALPPEARLRALDELVTLGYFRGIVKLLDEIDAELPQCGRFVAQMRELARGFRLEQMSNVIRHALASR